MRLDYIIATVAVVIIGAAIAAFYNAAYQSGVAKCEKVKIEKAQQTTQKRIAISAYRPSDAEFFDSMSNDEQW